ncbi:hypothetical protein ES703_78628 [subsurface metagenome]
MPISTSLSNLPGLLSAGSIASGLLVAPMTMTFPLPLRPSMEARSWATTLRSTSPVTSLLFGAMASISSMKSMLGAFFSASSNIFLIRASDSP